MKKKIISLIVVLSVICLTFTGCYEKSTEQKIADQQNQLLQQVTDQIGMPDIKEFFEKKMAKEIIELRDNSKLVCHAYTKNEMTGKYIYEGKCMGFGLPYSVQYTNPQTVQRFSTPGGATWEIVPQADPNGLYMPDSAAATWLMMINEDTGKIEVQYYEPNIVVTQSKKPRRLCDESSLPKDY